MCHYSGKVAGSVAVKSRCSFPWPSLSTTGFLSLVSGHFQILTSRPGHRADTSLVQTGTPTKRHTVPHWPGKTPVLTGLSVTLPDFLRGHLGEIWFLITKFHGKDASWCRQLLWMWEILCLLLLPQTPCKHMLCDMVSFMCQLSWAMGCPRYLVKCYSGCFCEGGFG